MKTKKTGINVIVQSADSSLPPQTLADFTPGDAIQIDPATGIAQEVPADLTQGNDMTEETSTPAETDAAIPADAPAADQTTTGTTDAPTPTEQPTDAPVVDSAAVDPAQGVTAAQEQAAQAPNEAAVPTPEVNVRLANPDLVIPNDGTGAIDTVASETTPVEEITTDAPTAAVEAAPEPTPEVTQTEPVMTEAVSTPVAEQISESIAAAAPVFPSDPVVAVTQEPMPPFANSTLVTPGATTLLHNLDNILAAKQAEADQAAGLHLFEEELRALVRDVIATGSIEARVALGEILDYVKVMVPGSPISDDIGANMQLRLFRTLINMINKGSADWKKFFSVFLAIFNALKGEGQVFGDRHVFRFLPIVRMNEEERTAFQYLIHLFKATSDHNTRAFALKQVDLSKATSYGLNEAGIQRLISFYHV